MLAGGLSAQCEAQREVGVAYRSGSPGKGSQGWAGTGGGSQAANVYQEQEMRRWGQQPASVQSVTRQWDQCNEGSGPRGHVRQPQWMRQGEGSFRERQHLGAMGVLPSGRQDSHPIT